MPKLELKTIYAELDQGLVRPFYWVYGPELLKGRELLNRIRKVVNAQWSEETLDGSEVDSQEVYDRVMSLCLGGGVPLVVVRDAHQLRRPEALSDLFGPPQPLSDVGGVCVCFSKDLDSRKKFSKSLLDRAAVISCDEIPEDQRGQWIHYLAKRQGVNVSETVIQKWISLEPWSLEVIVQELSKVAITDGNLEESYDLDRAWRADEWIDSFFSRNRRETLSRLSTLSENPDLALPLLGLLGWNTKQLASYLADAQAQTHSFKTYPQQLARLKQWESDWKLTEVIDLQRELFELDLNFKQAPFLPLGLWTSLVCRFCGAPELKSQLGC